MKVKELREKTSEDLNNELIELKDGCSSPFSMPPISWRTPSAAQRKSSIARSELFSVA